MIDARLSLEIEVGARAFPIFATEIINLDGGGEVRNRRWRYPKHRFEFDLEPTERDNARYQEFRALFYAAGGAHESWLFTHWADNEAQDQQVLAITGSTTQFQLAKNYTIAGITQVRKITRPVDGSVQVYVAGSPVAPAIDYDTGLITFGGAPAEVPTADFQFEIPVRFMDDECEFIGLTDVLEKPVSIQIMEVRE